MLYISRDKNAETNFLTNIKSKKVMGLFAKLEVIRTISFKNYIILLIMVVLYGVTLGLGMYTFLNLNERPYEYGVYAPILIILLIVYYIIFFLCIYKIDSYKDNINLILDEFEEEHQCKIRIRKHKKGFEINWNPQISDKKGKTKG